MRNCRKHLEQLVRLTVSILACSCTVSVAYAEIYKCKDSRGVASYKDAPCAGSEREEAVLPGGKAPGMVKVSGLWETIEVKQPRISDKRPGAVRDPIPKKYVSCLNESPAKFVISHPSCRAQVAGGGGTCVINQKFKKDIPPDQEVTAITTVTGDYRHYIHITSQVKSVYKNNPSNHWIDQNKFDFSYLGPCKAGMWWGTKYELTPNGEWVQAK